MKKKQFDKLQELVSLRQTLAHAQLQEAHRHLILCREAIETAKAEYQAIRETGDVKIKSFLSEIHRKHSSNYHSKLSELRALTARLDYDISQAKLQIEQAEQSMEEAELSVQKRQKEYYAATQKVEKINFLADHFKDEELRNLNNVQEIDRLEGGLKNSSNHVVR